MYRFGAGAQELDLCFSDIFWHRAEDGKTWQTWEEAGDVVVT